MRRKLRNTTQKKRRTRRRRGASAAASRRRQRRTYRARGGAECEKCCDPRPTPIEIPLPPMREATIKNVSYRIENGRKVPVIVMGDDYPDKQTLKKMGIISEEDDNIMDAHHANYLRVNPKFQPDAVDFFVADPFLGKGKRVKPHIERIVFTEPDPAAALK